MPRYALRIEYNGGPFRGWQRQRALPSVQGAVETANYTDGNSNSLLFLTQVDGVTVSTQNELHDALKAGGGEKTLAILGSTLS